MDIETSKTAMQRLGRVLQEVRECKEISQRKVAKDAGLTWEEVSRLEKGKTAPELAPFLKLLMCYELPPDALLARICEPDRKVRFLLKKAASVYKVYETMRKREAS